MLDISHYWYRQSFHPLTFFLFPFSWLFKMAVIVRRGLYKKGLFKSQRFPKPIIIVGNINIGGTGKTPFVIELARFLRTQGYHPGIVSRGVGGKKHKTPHWVCLNDSAKEVGDEALLLLQNTQCPVVIGIDRVAAVQTLLQGTQCDIIIADDGLQHYRLDRDVEIVMVDGQRGFGNRLVLPAGPLREPVARLAQADFVVVKEPLLSKRDDIGPHHAFTLIPDQLISLKTPSQQIIPDQFPHKKIHAIAGIGYPETFFDLLSRLGFNVIPHAFPDHHLYLPHELQFADPYPILMTEKDAVKCSAFADERCWYLSITARIGEVFKEELLKKVQKAISLRPQLEENSLC